MAFSIPSNTLPSTPSGLSGVFRRYGGTPERMTALLTPLDPLFPKVARHFAATHGKTNQREFTQFKMRDQFVQVLGKRVVVVARGWLAGLAETSAVICDDAVSRVQENRNLLLPGRAAQWISVN